MNLVLSEVEETVSIVDVSEDGEARGVRVSTPFFRAKHRCFGLGDVL
jgi:hypothetical protein